MKPVHITARDLPEAWFLCLEEVMKHGRDYKITEGSYEGQKRKQLDYFTVHVKYPNNLPLLPDIPPGLGVPSPADEKYLEDYLEYLMTSKKEPQEDYTYGERLNDPRLRIKGKEYVMGVNQIDAVIKKYVDGGHGQNQCTMEIGMPSDISLDDPPCLRLIDTMILDGQLNFFPYFRSWDLWGGFPANLAGLQMLKEYMAMEIGVEDGEIMASSKGIHLYDHCWDVANMRLYKFEDKKE
ncbi:MAG: thymidylate synthase [Nanoarchaeota archaeon]|nr:thymidylate synthase [Nanoarchaeota archaeon]MCG2718204.1 thymidylate synthase [Nanoarchaeota archaeon]